MTHLTKTGIYLATAIIGLGVASCSKESPEGGEQQQGGKQQFTVQSADLSRTTLDGIDTRWAADDGIGISSSESSRFNVEFTADQSGIETTITNQEAPMLWGENPTHNFYAYYPYNSASTGIPNALPVSVPSAQTQLRVDNSVHIGTLDQMVASIKGLSSGTAGEEVPNLGFNFSHLWSMLELTVGGAWNCSVAEVIMEVADTSIPLAFTNAEINLNEEPEAGKSYSLSNITDPTNRITLTNSGAPNDKKTNNKVMRLMFNPSDMGGQIINVYTRAASGSTNQSMHRWQKYAPAAGFSPGVKYKFTVSTGDETNYTKQDEGWTASVSNNQGDAGANAALVVDGGHTTYLVLTKPDVLSNSITDADMYFTVDMLAEKSFNFIKLRHDIATNAVDYRISEISVYGSADGITFSAIEENIPVFNASPLICDYKIGFADTYTNYRYIKVQITGYTPYSTAYPTVRIAEIHVGKDN